MNEESWNVKTEACYIVYLYFDLSYAKIKINDQGRKIRMTV